MTPDQVYEILRLLASPILAVTSAHEGRTNGMILDSASRASLSPLRPRITVVIHKWHLSHRLILASGAFTAHLLRPEQLQLVHRLGFRSGHQVPDKLNGIDHALGMHGTPLLTDCHSALECRVLNIMDLGPSHLVLGEASRVIRGHGDSILTAPHFRASMPESWRTDFQRELAAAQKRSTEMSDAMANPAYDPQDWR